MKKQILSMVLCICMILALTPVFATTGETAPAACNVLFDEDFEDNASSLTIYDNKTATTDASGIYDIPDGAEYGQGNHALLLKNASKNVQKTSFGVTSGMLQGGAAGYTVEVNFDWNPFVSNASSVVRILCNQTVNAAWNASGVSNTVSLYLVDNGEKQLLTVYNRKNDSTGIVLNDEDLVTKIGAHVTDPDHVYRAKVVITSKDGAGADISVYLDDVLMVNFENGNSYKDRYLCGFQFQHTSLVERGTIDNIKVLEYGTGVTGANAYINDDALVTAIRRFEYEKTTIAEDKQEAYSAAIAAAKVACEASDRTQASVDAAVEALNNWDNVEEESEWSAVSSVNGKTVTIQATEDIATGKIIVANYNGTDLAHVNLPVFSGLAAGETIDVTVPDGWTGAVKVFFWDSNFDRLMPAEELTIQ